MGQYCTLSSLKSVTFYQMLLNYRKCYGWATQNVWVEYIYIYNFVLETCCDDRFQRAPCIGGRIISTWILKIVLNLQCLSQQMQNSSMQEYMHSYSKHPTCFGFFSAIFTEVFHTKKMKNTTLANYDMAVQLQIFKTYVKIVQKLLKTTEQTARTYTIKFII